jgi:hypothetical protein
MVGQGIAPDAFFRTALDKIVAGEFVCSAAANSDALTDYRGSNFPPGAALPGVTPTKAACTRCATKVCLARLFPGLCMTLTHTRGGGFS